MTKSFIAKKQYKPLGASKGDLLIQNDKSAEDLKMSELVEQGYFEEVSEAESLKYYKKQQGKAV